ncbi:GntR family transcriptional regulator [Glaciecola sp. MF2-115]|uniref:GntR family transcriptional regulator n=1 Tax=Glaciecola sp. MF2-115 TaxID=3384827 RepID=UPI0039A2040B
MSTEYKTRTQIVVEAIREKILTGEIKAGEPLRQSALADALNVSRIPVREALLQLEAEGLVEFEAHKGATATKLSTEQMNELFQLRALLETELLRLAIPNLTTADIENSQALLEKMAEAYDKEETKSSWSDLNTEFHLSLYGAANRPLTLDVVQNLYLKSDRYIRMHLALAGGVNKADGTHSLILEQCKKGEIDKACELLREHIISSSTDVIALLTESSAKNVKK